MSDRVEIDPRHADADLRLDETETMIWAMLDDQLDNAEMTRLSQLIEADAAVRARYIECVQLHVDLREHFGRAASEKAARTVVLPNLTHGLLGSPGVSHVID